MKRLNHVLCAALCSTAIATPAFAQDQDVDTPDNENVIIVTATQRATDVQDIPIAVTAVTPVELERQGIQDIKTLEAVSASFNLNSSQTESQGTTIRIRGIGTTGNNIGLESAVGVFIDGVYQSRPGVALGDLVDLQQLEVLRGPQGTLFGRNTTAGALNIKTAAPDLDEFEGFVNASYGNYDAISLQGGISVPIAIDQFAIRLSGAYRKRDGFLTNAVTGQGENNRDRYFLRGQALWEPTDALSIRIIGDYQKTNERCCGAVQLSTPSLATPALNAELFPGGTAGFRGAGGIINDDELISNASSVFENDIESWGISGELRYDFGPAELIYIGSYRDFVGDSRQDEFNAALVYSVSGDTFPPNSRKTFDEIITQTHEVRVQGSAFDDFLDFLVGAYYADETIDEFFQLGLGPDYARVVSQANTGNPAFLDLVSASGNFLATGNFVPVGSGGSFSQNLFSQQAESISVFTHNIFNLTDQFSVTLGARYVDDKKDGQFEQLTANNPFCNAGINFLGSVIADPAATVGALAPVFPGGAAGVAGFLPSVGTGAFLTCFPFAAPIAQGPTLGIPFLPQEFDSTFEDDELIYTAQVAFEPNSDLLLYGSYTHGYKAGGFNLDVTAAAGGGDPRFASEEIDAYELGIKSTLLNGRARANVAFFYNDVKDFQVLEFTGTNFQTFNVDDVTSKGVELELFSQWNDYVSNSLAITYTDAAYGDDCDASFLADNLLDASGNVINPASGLCGAQLTNAPEFVGIFGMTYDGPIARTTDWGVLANINVRYESDRRTRTNPTTGPFDVQESNFKINARLGFTTPDERFSIELFGQNLTNQITRNVTFNTPLLGDASSSFISDPRTYGVALRGKF